MNSYDRIEKLHEIDTMDYLITKRKSELLLMTDKKDLITEYLHLRNIIMKDLYKVKTRQALIKIFYALRLDYFIKDPDMLTSSDIYDSILKDEELFNHP